MPNKSFINWQKARKYRTMIIGLTLLSLIGITSIAAPLLTSFDPTHIDATQRLLEPGVQGHHFGTDSMGRDQFSRILYSGRHSIVVGLSVVFLTVTIGTLLGLICGYSSKIDIILMRILDGMMAFPSIILAVALVAALGPHPKNTVIALSLVYIPRMARVVRSAVIPIREADFVTAAIAMGSRDNRILLRHILPNSMGPIIVQGTAIMAYAVLAEASLSFLGVSGSVDTPTWGIMLNEARGYIRQAPWMATAPGLWIVVTVLSLNMVGDSLRDLLDPYMRRRL